MFRVRRWIRLRVTKLDAKLDAVIWAIKQWDWSRNNLFGLALFGLCIGLMGESLPLKTVAVALGTMGFALLFLATPRYVGLSILIFLAGVEGMLKVLSGFNKVVHVGVDLATCLLALRILWETWSHRIRLGRTLPPGGWILAAHIVWWAVLFANPLGLSFLAAVASGKAYVIPVLLLWISYNATNDSHEVRACLRVWILIGLINLVMGYQQFAGGPQSVLALSSNYARQLEKFNTDYRPFGTSSQAGGAAGFVTLAWPYLLIEGIAGKNPIMRVVCFVSIGAGLGLIFICKTRIFLFVVALVTIALVLLLVKTGNRALRLRTVGFTFPLIFAVVLSFPAFISQLREYSDQGDLAVQRFEALLDPHRLSHAREGAYERFIDYAKRYPFGVGGSRLGGARAIFEKELATDPFVPDELFSDNLFVHVIVETGIIGVIIFSLLMIASALPAIRGVFDRRHPVETRLISAAVLASMIGVVFSSTGSDTLTSSPMQQYYFIAAGCVGSLLRQTSKTTIT